MSERNGSPPTTRETGINVISYVSGNLGIGVTARNVVRLLQERGCAVSILDLDPGLGRKDYDRSYAALTVETVAQLPHAINLIVLPPAAIGDLLPMIVTQKPNAMNAGFCMWELPVLPEAWIRPMQALDVLVAESDFIRYAFEFNLSDVVTIPAVHPVYLPPGIGPDRARFGLPEDAVIFFTGFEPVSDPQRKNPFAAVRAFLAACGNDPRAHLVIKFNNAMVNGAVHPVVRELRELCAGHPRIRFMTETLTYADVLCLYASCDVFVSLHRSEGLGLGPMEAMALGRPALATAWSGNMSYMDHTNSCLVGYRLIPVDGSIGHYSRETLGRETVWAEPNVDEAAAWMRRLVDDAGFRAGLGRKAAADVAQHHARAREGRWVDELMAIYRQLAYLARESGDASDAVRRAVRQRRSDKIADYLGWRRRRETVDLRTRAYDLWVQQREPTEADRVRMMDRAADACGSMPPIHLLVRARAGTEARLADTLDSIGAQIVGDWRLSILADSPAPAGMSDSDDRIRWRVVRAADDENDAIHSAMEGVGGDWVAVLEAGDRLARHALASLAAASRAHPEWVLVYTDEDRIDKNGRRCDPRFKPDFDLERLRTQGYIGEFLLARRDVLEVVGGYVGGGEVRATDLALRIADRYGDAAIGHVADMLYHRDSAQETSAVATEAGRESLARHLARRGIDAVVRDGSLPGTFELEYRHAGPAPMVTVIVPTRDRLDLLQPCLSTLLTQTRYPALEVIVVDNASTDAATLVYLDQLPQRDARVKVLRYPHEFNYAAINNAAAHAAHGEYLLLLNNDTLIIQPDWLERMLSQARRPDVGIVGARLIFANRRVQHAGIVLGMGADGIANHPHLGMPLEDPGYLGRLAVAQEVGAVTGACLLVRKSVFDAVGGMDAERLHILYNDVDLCLRVRAQGLRVVWTPAATVVHHGSVSVGPGNHKPETIERYRREVATMLERWQPALAADRYFNPNLSLMNVDSLPDVDVDTRWHDPANGVPRLLAMGFGSGGSWEHRVRIPAQALDRAGLVAAAVIPHFEQGARVPSVTELARCGVQVLLLHNTVHDVHLAALERYRRHRPDLLVVFGQDDLMTNLPPGNPFSATVFKDMKKRLRSALALCDRLVVTTEPLADAFRGMIGDIRVVPNYLERAAWGGLSSRRRRGKRPRVGWAGAQQHAGDLALLHDVVAATIDEVEWVFMGMCPEPIRLRGVEQVPGVAFRDYPAALAGLDLDLALAPLEHHAFNAAKSNLRILEYGALGWPVLATDIEPYRDAPVTRLANNSRAWIEAIRAKVRDLDAAEKEGDALRQWVQRHWMLEDHVGAWSDAILAGTTPTAAPAVSPACANEGVGR